MTTATQTGTQTATRPASAPAPARTGLREDLLRRLADASPEEVTVETISADDSLREDLGLGSLDAIMLVLDLEEEFGIDVEDDELSALDTVASLLALVESKVPAVARGGA